jgi:hypothetical protein
MATAYTSLLGLALPVTGELSGTWGDTVNNSITSLLDTSVAGTTNVSTDADVTLTTTTGASNTARQAILLFSGARTVLRTVTAPAQSKVYTVINATTGGFSVKLVGAGPTTGVTIVAGESAVCAWNGSDFVKVSNTGGAASFTNVTVTGTTTLSGLTASTALALDASKNVVSVTNTGTGNNVLSASPTLTGTIGAASLTLSTDLTLSGGTASGVPYLNGSKVVTSGTALWFDGTNFGVGTGGNTLNQQSVVYKVGANAVYQQIANGSTGLASTNGIRVGVSSAGVGEWYSPTAAISYIDNSEQMRLTSTGLGIGTSSPSQKLDVAGIITATAWIGRANGSAPSADCAIYRAADNTLGFSTASTERMRLDSSGNLGLGVTPSAWNSVFKAVSVGRAGSNLFGQTSSNLTGVTANAIFDSSDWKYVTSDNASRYQQNSGVHSWFTAPTGTAGNAITFTQAMTLDASGRLALNTTSFVGNEQAIIAFNSSGSITQALNTKDLNASANGNSHIVLRRSDDTYLGAIGRNGTDNAMFVEGNSYLALRTGGTERARIDSSGNLLVGTTTPTANCKLTVTGAGISIAGGRGSTFALAYPDWSIYNTSSGNALAFDNGSERVRIDSSGNLLVGTTSDLGGLGGKVQISSGASRGIVQSTNSNTRMQEYLVSGTTVGFISNDGTSTTYSTSSDYRLKNTIAPMTGALAKVALLKPCTYKWNVNGSDGQGFIAHELAEVVPQCVTGAKDALDANGKIKPQGIDTSFLVATLTAAIQEQQAIIESLKARLDAANL